MRLTENLLYITYYLKRSTNEPDIVCKGCREIVYTDNELPSYIKGLIKFDGEYISVIDPNIYFHGQQSMLNNLACILIIEHIFEYRSCRTGIIIEDIDEIMSFAAGNYKNAALIPFTFNMNFVINALKKGHAEQFLSNTQKLLDMHEKRRHIIRGSLKRNCDEVIKAELVELTNLSESDIFNTNEFLAAI